MYNRQKSLYKKSRFNKKPYFIDDLYYDEYFYYEEDDYDSEEYLFFHFYDTLNVIYHNEKIYGFMDYEGNFLFKYTKV